MWPGVRAARTQRWSLGGAQEGQGRPGFPAVLDPLFLPAPGASLSLSGAAEQPRLSPGAQPGV